MVQQPLKETGGWGVENDREVTSFQRQRLYLFHFLSGPQPEGTCCSHIMIATHTFLIPFHTWPSIDLQDSQITLPLTGPASQTEAEL